MIIGKTGGEHVQFSIGWTGFSLFLPETRRTYMTWFGACIMLVGRPGVFLPCVAYGRASGAEHSNIYSVLKHWSGDRRVIRVGSLVAHQ